MSNSDDDLDLNPALNERTNALLMLNKEERKVIKELLIMTIYSESVRGYIEKRLGEEYVRVAEKLLETMGGL
ncbi:MAG TPA: hypothetical protein ENH70_07125 [Desulfobacteraceae bacterium]|nr:MAG: hypothetical protein DRG82_02560 [Deltaproteobacteria bacterium]HDZ24294.1 hypothetical protein [Desulfobacteraceae bacterium]